MVKGRKGESREEMESATRVVEILHQRRGHSSEMLHAIPSLVYGSDQDERRRSRSRPIGKTPHHRRRVQFGAATELSRTRVHRHHPAQWLRARSKLFARLYPVVKLRGSQKRYRHIARHEKYEFKAA